MPEDCGHTLVLARKFDIKRDCGHKLANVQLIVSRDDDQACLHCLLKDFLQLCEEDKYKLGKNWLKTIETAKQAVGS